MKITKSYLVNKVLDIFFNDYSSYVLSSPILKKEILSLSDVRNILFTRLKKRWNKADLFFASRHFLTSKVFDDLFLFFSIYGSSYSNLFNDSEFI